MGSFSGQGTKIPHYKKKEKESDFWKALRMGAGCQGSQSELNQISRLELSIQPPTSGKGRGAGG